MTLIEKILKEITETSFSYKGVRVNILGIPKFKKHSAGSLRTTVSDMHKRGLIGPSDKGWLITPAGKQYIKRKADSLINFYFNYPKNSPKKLIVMFDIPETRKTEREWFRWHLKKFNYLMIQKSVWVGPSPLPKEFMDYIERIKLKSSVKTFKLARAYDFKRK